MASPYEWRIDAIEQNARRAVDSLYKIDEVMRQISNLEDKVRELAHTVEQQAYKIEELQNITNQQKEYTIQDMQERLFNLENK